MVGELLTADKQALLKRFIKARDSGLNDKSDCYRCPFGEEFEYLEKLRYPALYRRWPNYRDGSLKQKANRPRADSKQCQMCFEGWVDDERDKGNICIQCGSWIVGGKAKAAMCIEVESRWENGYTTTKFLSTCSDCLLQGKTPDEWARGVVMAATAKRGEQ